MNSAHPDDQVGITIYRIPPDEPFDSGTEDNPHDPYCLVCRSTALDYSGNGTNSWYYRCPEHGRVWLLLQPGADQGFLLTMQESTKNANDQAWEAYRREHPSDIPF